MFEYLRPAYHPGRTPAPTSRRWRSEAVVKVSAWLRAQLVLAGVMGTFAGRRPWIDGRSRSFTVSRALVAAVGETIPDLSGRSSAASPRNRRRFAVTVSQPKLALMVAR